MITKSIYIKKPDDKNYKRLYPSGKKRYDSVFKNSSLDEVINFQKGFESTKKIVSVRYSNFGSMRTSVTKSKNGTLVKTVIKEHL